MVFAAFASLQCLTMRTLRGTIRLDAGRPSFTAIKPTATQVTAIRATAIKPTAIRVTAIPDYNNQANGNPGYGDPGYDNQANGNPGYGDPGYGAPAYAVPAPVCPYGYYGYYLPLTNAQPYVLLLRVLA